MRSSFISQLVLWRAFLRHQPDWNDIDIISALAGNKICSATAAGADTPSSNDRMHNHCPEYIRRSLSTEVDAPRIAQEELTRLAVATGVVGVPAETMTLTRKMWRLVCSIALGWYFGKLAIYMLLSDCEHPGIVAAAQETGARFGAGNPAPLATWTCGDPPGVIAQHLRPARLVVLIIFSGTRSKFCQCWILSSMQAAWLLPRPWGILVRAAQSQPARLRWIWRIATSTYAYGSPVWWCGPLGGWSL